jgi:hypothetical protein
MLLLLRDPPVKRCMLPNNTRRGRKKTNGMCGTKSSHDTTGCEEPKNRTRFWSVGLLKTQNSLSKLENRTVYLFLDFDCACRQCRHEGIPFTSIGRRRVAHRCAKQQRHIWRVSTRATKELRTCIYTYVHVCLEPKQHTYAYVPLGKMLNSARRWVPLLSILHARTKSSPPSRS